MAAIPLYAQFINLLAAILLLLAFAMLTQRRVLSLVNLFARKDWRWRVDRDRRLRHEPAASLRVGRADVRAQGRPAAVAPAPADPPAGREVGRRRTHQRAGYDAHRHRARRVLVQSRYPISQLASTVTRATLGIAMASVMLSFLMMITRRKALPQVIGFLAMENGLFFAATSATYGMPMVVELGIALDVLVGMLILGVFFFQIRSSSTVSTLKHLEK
jgi:hydrogenase-4 component E